MTDDDPPDERPASTERTGHDHGADDSRMDDGNPSSSRRDVLKTIGASAATAGIASEQLNLVGSASAASGDVTGDMKQLYITSNEGIFSYTNNENVDSPFYKVWGPDSNFDSFADSWGGIESFTPEDKSKPYVYGVVDPADNSNKVVRVPTNPIQSNMPSGSERREAHPVDDDASIGEGVGMFTIGNDLYFAGAVDSNTSGLFVRLLPSEVGTSPSNPVFSEFGGDNVSVTEFDFSGDLSAAFKNPLTKVVYLAYQTTFDRHIVTYNRDPDGPNPDEWSLQADDGDIAYPDLGDSRLKDSIKIHDFAYADPGPSNGLPGVYALVGGSYTNIDTGDGGYWLGVLKDREPLNPTWQRLTFFDPDIGGPLVGDSTSAEAVINRGLPREMVSRDGHLYVRTEGFGSGYTIKFELEYDGDEDAVVTGYETNTNKDGIYADRTGVYTADDSCVTVQQDGSIQANVCDVFEDDDGDGAVGRTEDMLREGCDFVEQSNIASQKAQYIDENNVSERTSGGAIGVDAQEKVSEEVNNLDAEIGDSVSRLQACKATKRMVLGEEMAVHALDILGSVDYSTWQEEDRVIDGFELLSKKGPNKDDPDYQEFMPLYEQENPNFAQNLVPKYINHLVSALWDIAWNLFPFSKVGIVNRMGPLLNRVNRAVGRVLNRMGMNLPFDMDAIWQRIRQDVREVIEENRDNIDETYTGVVLKRIGFRIKALTVPMAEMEFVERETQGPVSDSVATEFYTGSAPLSETTKSVAESIEEITTALGPGNDAVPEDADYGFALNEQYEGLYQMDSNSLEVQDQLNQFSDATNDWWTARWSAFFELLGMGTAQFNRFATLLSNLIGELFGWVGPLFTLLELDDADQPLFMINKALNEKGTAMTEAGY